MDIIIKQKNSLYLEILCEDGISFELFNYFSFYVKNYKFMPKYKAGIWNGKIHLFNYKDNTIYIGLLYKIILFCETNGYEYAIDVYDTDDNIKITNEYLSSLSLPFKTRDYQIEATEYILNNKKCIIESATSSGKSFILYLAFKKLLEKNKKILLIVPRVSLVEQMYSDFESYEKSFVKNCNKISQYYDKDNNNNVIISTWQSLMNIDITWFDEFDAIFVDEVHEADSKEMIKLCQKCRNVEYRVGLSGSLKNFLSSKLTLIGLFGEIKHIISAKELIERKEASDLTIKCLLLKYDISYKMSYDEEIDFLISHKNRNNAIINLSNRLEGNTIILYNFVKKHGQVLYDLLKEKSKKKIVFITQKTSINDREKIRAYCEKHNDVIILSSMKLFSTGVNIKNLRNCILSHPQKGENKTIQSIGRILRLDGKDNQAFLYDISDHFLYKNKSYQYYNIRKRIYKNEYSNMKEIILHIPTG